MSAVLITTALAVALVCVPSIAAITAMGLSGGDGEPRNAFFGGEPAWRWWLMLLPPAAGLLGVLTYGDEPDNSSGWDRLVGVAMQLALAIPAALLLASDAVTL